MERKEEVVRLFFMPYDEKMSTARGFRVFCTPEEGKIAAVSQYKWYLFVLLRLTTILVHRKASQTFKSSFR